ncbi:hypothetical protein B0H67DRAFT_486799 [Lasiosphaeris hirsuta]|uniref:GDP/GTP exchange factor Sec2 N-terminal domain-containing protein n=1 Tax=Lasiosphaeris hirsuta TaxID=260670 RepID=A0AA40AQC5_9PEZI|nr:hypothetical protein B0H67DRAFT_486799 [Lasiosphaeris hirsuta]
MAVAPAVTLSPAQCCPQCGFDVGLPPLEDTQSALLSAQKQIADLQAQVRLLNQKASAAVDRWADYEDELAKLRTDLDNSVSSASPARSSFLSSSAASRLSSLLSPRKSIPSLKPLPAVPPTPPSQPQQQRATLAGLGPSPFPFSAATPLSSSPSTDDLLEALTREQALRLEAEGRLSETSREVEELSVSLFEQANEMVATERRARAKLEERVETLERRDVDKRRRLERLESAMERIERVRGLLGQTTSQAQPQKQGYPGSGWLRS